MKRMILGALGLVLLASSTAYALWGQQNFLQGTIKDIQSNMITLIVEEPENIQEVAIKINDQTNFQESASLDSLQEGDKVKVDYKEEGGQKVAVAIAKVVEAKPQPQERI
ncbi:MAG: DUF5666 domain-containing protein [Candidatus Omnitrophota bacterium]|nr:DUF5666 domain-containing protein [Candidatus Omnitrophota bacterium]MDZ4243007.1 DUF5666 domain-containing protein [Candidatus Omnitrophota bacterium]